MQRGQRSAQGAPLIGAQLGVLFFDPRLKAGDQHGVPVQVKRRRFGRGQQQLLTAEPGTFRRGDPLQQGHLGARPKGLIGPEDLDDNVGVGAAHSGHARAEWDAIAHTEGVGRTDTL